MNLIAEIADRHPPAAPAIRCGGQGISYGELFERARPIADDIRAAADELGRRPRVGLQCPNGVEYIVLSMAVLLADACLVPLAEEITDRERDEIVRSTAIDRILASDGAGAARLSSPESPSPPGFPESEFQALRPAFIRFSSGTTGTSKGIVLSHESLRARILAANEGMKLGREDRVLWMLPMAHHFAVSIVLYLWSGALTILEPSPTREAILATAERERATVIYGSPFHFALLAADPGSFRWPSLRLPVATAAPLPEATARAFAKRFGQAVVQGLGIIEVGIPVLNLRQADRKPTALGRPLPAYRVELRDDLGNPVPDGQAGEFHVRGPGFLDAYLVPWDPAPLADGFFASGDLVVRDAEGDLTLVGRRKSVINVAGMKVFPEEIEAVLDLHPGVRRSRVLPRDHPQAGQVPVAEFIPTDPDSPPKPIELQRHCRPHLSSYKIPLRFVPVAALPLTASGKIRRL